MHGRTIGPPDAGAEIMRVHDQSIYLGDNGRCYCGEHLGYTAKATGRDLSGQAVYRVTPEDAREAQAMGATLTCEQPRCGRTASLLAVA
jgi:hypothetical protein